VRDMAARTHEEYWRGVRDRRSDQRERSEERRGGCAQDVTVDRRH